MSKPLDPLERSEYGLIETIRTRPGMYLGTKSITALWHFMNGYKFARLEAGAHSPASLFPPDFQYFDEYVRHRLGRSGNAGWRNHILWHCREDEEAAFDVFLELFDKFKAIRAVKYWSAALSDENKAFNNEMRRCARMCGSSFTEKRPRFDDPVSVYVTELSAGAYLLAVETLSGTEVIPSFCKTFEDAAGNGYFPQGAETYFGKIVGWIEHSGEPPFK